MLPPVKTEKEHGRWFNGWRSAKAAGSRGVQWLHDIGLAEASVNVVQTGINTPKPSRSTPNHAGTYGVDVAKTPSISTTSPSGLITTAGRPTENWGWQNVEDMQRDTVMRGLEQTINANRQSFSGMPQNPINYQSLWGEGVGTQVQLPPMNTEDLGRSISEHTIPGVKHYPEGDRTQSNIPKWLRYFASGGETLDPQERIDRNTQALVATTKAAGKALGGIADELRSFGCISAKFDQGQVTLRFDRTISSQIDALMDQYLPNMDHVPNFRYVEFTASIANDIFLNAFMAPFFAERMAYRARPLVDRALIMTKGHSRELRFLRSINEPAYRSGFVSDKTVARLAERNVRTITSTFRPGYCGPSVCKTLNSRHFNQAQKYGKTSYRFLENGKNRYYGIMKPPRIKGEMVGRRRVREWDPATGLKRTWHETIDKNGVVRSIRPERNNGVKIHYIFDENGVFEGIR